MLNDLINTDKDKFGNTVGLEKQTEDLKSEHLSDEAVASAVLEDNLTAVFTNGSKVY